MMRQAEGDPTKGTGTGRVNFGGVPVGLGDKVNIRWRPTGDSVPRRMDDCVVVHAEDELGPEPFVELADSDGNPIGAFTPSTLKRFEVIHPADGFKVN